MPDLTLLELFDEIRGKTLRVLKDVTEEDARARVPGSNNSILWHAGHALVVVEHLVGSTLRERDDGQTFLPPGWTALFDWNSRPHATPPERWPALREVVERLVGQRDRLRPQIASRSEEWLARATTPDDPKALTRRREMIHALQDEACHDGEIWLLRKLMKHRQAASALST